MMDRQLLRAVLQLPAADRLALARELVESVAEPAPLGAAAHEGFRRIEEVGRVAGLTDAQYRALLST